MENSILKHAVQITANISEFNSRIDEVVQKLSFTDKEASKYGRAMEKALNSISPEAQKVGMAMDNLNKKYQDQVETLEGYSAQALHCGHDLRQLTDQYASQQEQIAQTTEKLARLKDRYAEVTSAIQKINERKAGGEKIDIMEYTGLINEQEAIREQIQMTNEQLLDQQDILSSTGKAITNYSDAGESYLNAAQSQTQAIEQTKASMLSYIDSSKALTTVKQFFNGLRIAAVSLAKEMGKFAVQSIGKLRAGIKSLNTHFKKLASDGLKNAGNLVKKLGEHFKESHSKSNGLSDAVKKLTHSFSSLGSMLIRRFKRAIVSNIFNGLVDGIKSLAKESPEFNYAISSMLSALQQFANQLAAVVGPIVQAVAPVFTKLIQILTATTEKVAQFTAMITGNTTYKKATPVNYDYAKSLETQAKSTDKTTKATKEATKETEKFKRSLLGFDELNILGSDENTIGDDLTDTIEDVKDAEITPPKFDTVGFDAVSDKLKKLVNDLKSMFNKKDWNGLGHVMADAVNDAFSWIDNLVKWENCGEKIKEIVKAITGTINGFVDGLDPAIIGGAIGDFINTIVNTLTLFIEGIDWYAMGSKFGEIIANIFSTVDWWNIGVLFSDGINSIIALITGFVDSVPWDQVGSDIATSVYSLFMGIQWDKAGELIGKGLNAIFSLFVGFVDTIPWADIGLQLATFVNSIFDTIKWDQIGEFIGKSLNGIIDFFISFLKNTKWFEIGRDFGTLVYTTLTTVNWHNVGTTLMKGINSALDLLLGFIKTPGLFESIGTSFHDLLCGAIEEFDEEKWGAAMAALFNGVFTALKKAFQNPEKFKEFGEKIASNINKFFKDLKPDDFTEAINKMLRSFLEFMAGLIKGLDWDLIKEKVGTALAGINWGDAFKVFGVFFLIHGAIHLPGIALKAAGILGTHLLSAIKGIDVLSACNVLKANLITGLNEFTVAGETLLKGAAASFATLGLAAADAYMVAYDVGKLKESTDGFTQVQKDCNETIEESLNAFKRLYETYGPEIANEYAKMRCDIETEGMSLEEGQKALTKALEEEAGKQPKNMWDAWCNNWNTYFGEDGLGLYYAMEDGVNCAIEGIRGLLGINSPSTVFEDIGMNVCEGFKIGLSNIGAAIDSALGGVWEHITRPFFDAQSSVSEIANTIGGAGNDIIKHIYADLSNFSTDVTNTVNNIMTQIGGMAQSVSQTLGQSIGGGGVLQGIGGSTTAIKPSVTYNVDIDLDAGHNITSRLNSVGSIFSPNSSGVYAEPYQVDIDLGGFANGGFPEDGLFMANHNELVGQFSNGRTAVANDDQIIEGIKGGVQDAIAPFMLSLMSTIRDSNNSGGESVIEIDGERLARIVTRNQNRINIRESAF